MTRIATTADGLARIEGEHLTLIDSPFPDVGAALAAGVGLDELAAAPAIAELPLDPTMLRAPIARPPKIWIVGFAYHTHQNETGHEVTEGEPGTSLVAGSAVCGPHDPIVLPPAAPDFVDYEGELVVVIGKQATAVSEADAWSVIAGYTVGNDVSARDVQKGRRTGWPANPGMAKSFDTFKPIGPAVVTVDEFTDPEDLRLRTWVDGELRQEARTSQLVWSVPHLVSFLSSATTLLPGDLICTGTPGGVGHPTGRFLGPGSVVRVEVEGVGAIENTVTAA